ncbi:unnamed protein product [Lactuca saligna]|uniref:Uncharacterized protein n=1 Tax=Lactuca saligna TaxID=75948 RepID=A0AA36EQU6_LACSI|nr:unnamed protein product [Lactuca saligna]
MMGSRVDASIEVVDDDRVQRSCGEVGVNGDCTYTDEHSCNSGKGLSNRLCAILTISVSPAFVENLMWFNGKINQESQTLRQRNEDEG